MSHNYDSHPVYRGERFTKTGRLLITSRQLMALNALLDTPNGEVSSLAEWHRLVRRYEVCLHRDSVWRIPIGWVLIVPNGNRIGAVLGSRGRQILEGSIPMHIQGLGHIGTVKEFLAKR